MARRIHIFENPDRQTAIDRNGLPEMGILYELLIADDRSFYEPWGLAGKEDRRLIRIQRAQPVLQFGLIAEYTRIVSLFARFEYRQSILFHLLQVFIES